MRAKGKKVINSLLVLFLLFTFFQTQPIENIAMAQSTNFVVQGRVTDGLGNGLAGVTVFADPKYKVFLPMVSGSGVLVNSQSSNTAITNFFPSAVTDPDGYYTFLIFLQALIISSGYARCHLNPENARSTRRPPGARTLTFQVTAPVITPETVVLTDLSNIYLDAGTYDGRLSISHK